MDGPEVSLNGSPTVSPTTAALWQSLPLPPKFPASICFLALSQAPPELDMKMARRKPVAVEPEISIPAEDDADKQEKAGEDANEQ